VLESLKADVLAANLELVRRGLVVLTWGNASAIDREQGLMVIKPSGVPYETMRREDMAVVNLNGEVVEGACKPSVDTATHLVLYKAFAEIGGVVHTHSHYATCWAQAGRAIPCFGTTHADLAHGEVPVTDPLSAEEVAQDYERHIGEVIVRRYRDLNPLHFPAVLAAQHAPFAWGRTVAEAVETAAALEEVARMALHTLTLKPDLPPIPQYLLDKHFRRKHGSGAYYGQTR
jgi:L-ribulose-5-phosphate 4-epimerase